MLTYVIIAAVVAILGLVGFIAMRAPEFRVSRSATLDAPAAAVFNQVNSFHNWEAWSPWAKIDPNMNQTYEGPPAGTGAVYTWTGNKEVGQGRMTILESQPNERIRIELEFIKPFPGTNDTLFTFTENNGNTEVTWTMTGKKTFLTKAIGIIMNMDNMIGGQFEKGLAQLETAAKQSSSADTADTANQAADKAGDTPS